MLQAFADVIDFQIRLFLGNPRNAISMVVLLDFLIGYCILSIYSGRRAHDVERWLVPVLILVIVWICIELMEKAKWLS